MAADLFDEDFRDELGGVAEEMKRTGELADGVARSVSSAFRGAAEICARLLRATFGEAP